MPTNAWLNSGRCLIVAHRGASSQLPENPLAAFALALEQGADGIELDVRLSKEGTPVIVHDATLSRIAGIPQKVSQFTAEELREVDCGQGQTVPALRDLFEQFGSTTLYDIELKNFGWGNRKMVEEVAVLVEKFGLQLQALVSSFNPSLVSMARERFDSSVVLALIRGPGLLRFTRTSANVRAENPHFSLVDRQYVERAQRLGLHSFPWTVDEVGEAQRLLALGVNGLITNEPALLRQHLGSDIPLNTM